GRDRAGRKPGSQPPASPGPKGGPPAAPLVASKNRILPSIVPTAIRLPSGANATALTTERPGIRTSGRLVAVSNTAAPRWYSAATNRLPSGLNATSVTTSVGPPSGAPIACSPFMFHTTAERRCELASVRPSGLKAMPLTELVSAVSGVPYWTPVLTSQTKTGPSKEPAARRRPSGLRSSEPAGLSPTESGGRARPPGPTPAEGTPPGASLALLVPPPPAPNASAPPPPPP